MSLTVKAFGIPFGIAALIFLPIPTVAAAGLILALGHEYVLMSEVDLAITLPDYFSALVRSKIGCRYIMVDAQCGEVLHIPGVMTTTEVRASFKT